MAFYGIASNLVIYLTKELHEDTVSSARNVNNWTGVVWLTPILGAYISDTYFGRYWTFLASSIIYLLGMVSVCMTTVIPSTVLAQVNTLFVKQGTTLECHIGPAGFEIPAASLSAFITLSMLIAVPIYDRHMVPLLRRHTGNPRGITILQRMSVGCDVHILVMVFATLTEAKRVYVIRQHGLENSKETILMSIFWFLPQYSLMEVTDVFVVIGMFNFFYDQSPVDMQSLVFSSLRLRN